MTQFQAPPASTTRTRDSDGHQPESRSKKGLIGVVIGLVILLAAGAGAYFGFIKGGDDSTPQERLLAALDQTLNAGPMKLTVMTNNVETTSLVDYSKDLSLTEIGGPGNPADAAIFMRGTERLWRSEISQSPLEVGVWYRLPSGGPQMPMAHSTFDTDLLRDQITSSTQIVEDGTEEINGDTTTRFVVTINKDVIIDQMLEAMGVPEGEPVNEEVRASIAGEIPAETKVWVNSAGLQVRVDTGQQVMTHSEIGEPINWPEIDEAAIKEMPIG